MDNDTVKGNMTLYAKWAPGLYTVLLDANGGTCSQFGITVRYLSAYSELPVPTRDDHEFIGWFTAAEGGEAVSEETILDTVPTTEAPVRIYAHWKARNCTVTLDPTGGEALDPISVPIDGVYGELPEATRTGYTFVGWFTAAEGGTQVKAGDAVDPTQKTFYARWTANTYRLTFNANGGTNVSGKDVTYDTPYGELPAPTRIGYDFAGWFTAAEGGKKIEAADTVKTAENHTLYAQWTAGQYTVTLDPGKGQCDTKTIRVSYDGTYANLPEAERKGHTFDGWFTEATGGTQVKTDTAVTRTENHTLYAQWTANTYKVTFDANGGSAAQEITVTFGKSYANLPTTSRTGYTFAGWYTASVNGMRVDNTTIVDTAEDHILYAVWTANTYRVNFDTDGGSAAAEMEVTFDGTYGTLPATTRKGYTFDGWFTAKDGGDRVESTDTVITAEDHTLYAHWTVNTYQVTFDANGGSAAAEMSVTFDAAYGTLPVTTRTGYRFDGWFTEKEGGGKVKGTDKVTTDANHTLYAHWTANTYKVRFDTDGGSAAAELTVTYDDAYGALPKTTRAGYTFDGWFTAKDGGDKVESTDKVITAEDHTLYAHWTVLPADRPAVSICEDLILTYGYKDGSISVTGAAAQGYILNFLWYRCGKDGTDAEAIDGATAAKYDLPTGMAAGTIYYRCEVTATRKDNGQKNTVLSDIITVTVQRAERTASLTMAGYTYGEAVPIPELTGNTENGKVTYYYQSAGAERKLWQDISSTSLAAGEYTLIAVIGQTANFNGCEATASFTVAKATPVVSEWPVLGTIYVNDMLETERTGTALVQGTFTVTGETKWNEAGTKTTELTFTPADTGNYTVLTHEASVTVIRRTVRAVTTSVAAVTDKNYGTEPSALGLPETVSIVTEDGKTFENVPVTWNGYDAALLTEQTLTGTLDLSAISNEVMQPDEAVTASASVTLRELTPGSAVLENKTATYTGEPIPHTIGESITGVSSVRYVYESTEYAASETAPTDVGTYTVTAIFTMQPGYTPLASVCATLTIEKADGSLTAPAAAELTYNGRSQPLLLAGSTATGTLEYKLDGGEYGTAVPEATAAGSYTVFYRVVGDKNHKDLAEQQLTVTIAPKPVTEPEADSTSFSYNGAAQTYAVAASDDYTVTGNVQTNAGRYTVAVALKDKDNTVWADDKTTTDIALAFEIRPAGVTVTASDKTIYVGEAVPDLFAPKLGEDYTVTGLIGEDVLTALPTLHYDPAQPDTASVGEARICIAGADAGSNYVISYAEGKLMITDRPLFAIEATAAEHGTLLLTATSAIEGTVITVTSMPDEGWRLASVTATDASGSALTLTDGGNGLYTFLMPARAVTLHATFRRISEQTPFDDVHPDDYYCEAIRWAVETGVTDGYGEGIFAPDLPCTRAQFVTFLWRVMDKPEPTRQETPFTDVAADAYYAKAVAWAVEEGITMGITETTFCPDETCTRAQTVTFLYRAYRAVPPAGEPQFADVAPDAYYADAVKWAAENEVTFGVGNGRFAPDALCTRAQTTAFLWRLYGKP